MMSFDFIGVTLAAFDTVGINSTLSEESTVALFPDLIPENLIKSVADYMTLVLGINSAFKT